MGRPNMVLGTLEPLQNCRSLFLDSNFKDSSPAPPAATLPCPPGEIPKCNRPLRLPQPVRGCFLQNPNSCRPLPASPRRTPSVTVGCRGHPKRSCSRCGEESMQAVLIDICIQNCLVLSNHPKISEGLSAHFKCG